MVSPLTAGSRLLAESTEPWTTELNQRGIKAVHTRTTNSSTTTTEVGVIRLDDVALAADRAYLIQTSNLRLTGGANDNVTVRLRATTNGTTPTTSSTAIATASADIDDVGTYEHAQLSLIYETLFGAETFSVLLTVARAAGTAGNAGLGGDPAFPIQLSIVDVGPALGNSGTDI